MKERTLLFQIVTGITRLAGLLVFGILVFCIYDFFKKSIDIEIERLQYASPEVSTFASLPYEPPLPSVVDGVDVATGMPVDANFTLVKNVCTACHSSKLITQNRATRQGWKDMIVWMQKTQGLPDLGSAEPAILDYLSTHFAPEEVGRRPALSDEDIEWYRLDL